jgi:hypothetical protein
MFKHQQKKTQKQTTAQTKTKKLFVFLRGIYIQKKKVNYL